MQTAASDVDHLANFTQALRVQLELGNDEPLPVRFPEPPGQRKETITVSRSLYDTFCVILATAEIFDKMNQEERVAWVMALPQASGGVKIADALRQSAGFLQM